MIYIFIDFCDFVLFFTIVFGEKVYYNCFGY